MKKLMFLMVALLVVPAMAAVEITLVEVEGECAVDLVITATGDDAVAGKSLVAGIAVTVSVGAGEEITSITNYMETGVSVDGATGYGIYMGTITFTGGDPEDIDDVGTPVAPATAPDAPGQLPGESCVLEFGGLFDVANANDAPDDVTTLARINLAGDATVTVTEEIPTRGGIVNIGGTAPSGVVMPAPTAVVCVTDCYAGQPDWDEYVAMGMPKSWCNTRQCEGDADGLQEGSPFTGYWWVGVLDLNILISGWKNQVYVDPDTNPWIAADFDHAQEGSPFTGYWRVGVLDLNILIGNWKDDADILADCLD